MKRILIIALALLSTIPAAAQKQPAFDRGFNKSNSIFVPKGMMTGGSSISFSKYTAGKGENAGYDMLSLLTGIEGELSTVRVSPAVFYFIKNNLAVGARLGYSYTSLDLDNASMRLDEDNEFDLSNHYFAHQSYSCSAALRNYIPLFNSRVFAMFNEVRLGGSFSQGKSYQLNDGEKDGTFTDEYTVKIGVYPGLTAFLTNNLSFEIAVGVLTCSYSDSKQKKNQVEAGRLSHFGTSYKPDLLGLTFSMMYYFPIKNK